jgi:hypothetical protein
MYNRAVHLGARRLKLGFVWPSALYLHFLKCVDAFLSKYVKIIANNMTYEKCLLNILCNFSTELNEIHNEQEDIFVKAFQNIISLTEVLT